MQHTSLNLQEVLDSNYDSYVKEKPVVLWTTHKEFALGASLWDSPRKSSLENERHSCNMVLGFSLLIL